MSETETVAIPAGEARAVRLAPGRRARIVNTQGGQVVDTWAFSAADTAEHLSMAHSRSALYSLYFRAGDVLVTNLFRPILGIAADTSPGFHDTLHAACSAESYRFYAVTEPDPHPNCEDNLKAAMREFGVRLDAVPSPWNLFERATVGADGRLADEPSAAKAGDYVELEALLDLVLVCSACPSTVGAISGAAAPRGAAIELL